MDDGGSPTTGMKKLSNRLMKLFGVDTDDVTEEEIISMVNEGHEQGVLQANEAEMIHNIFEFGDKDAKDIMVHRKNIIAIDGTMTFLEMLDFTIENNYSRYPVYIDDIDNIRKNIYKSKSVTELMGYEGNIRKIYYKSWNTIVNQNINFEKRVKNPPDNMINTLISFVNTMIYTRVLSEIYKTQLNPTVSFLHEPGTRRFSLALDISEIFKPLLGDRLIFSLLNKNQINERSFTESLNFLHLKKEASQIIARELDSRMQTTIKHKELNRDVSYQYLIRLECYKLIKHLIGEKEYEPFKIWW